MKKALLLIDFINEIVHPEGKLSGKGYADFIAKHHTLEHVASAIQIARDKQLLIVHVRVGFSESYIEQPKSSPLFGKAHEFQVFKLDSWGTEFHQKIDVQPTDVMITKHRVNAFHQTPLDLILRNNQVNSLLIAGVSTDLAVANATRDAHDRDYQVTVLADCCAAPSEEEHNASLLSLKKIAAIATINDIFKL